MKKYLGYAICGLKESVVYRTDILCSLLNAMTMLAASYFLWAAVFQDHMVVSGYHWNEMQVYIVGVFLCGNMMNAYFEPMIAMNIINGTIIFDLLKPTAYQRMLLFRIAGQSIGTFFPVIILQTVILQLLGLFNEFSPLQFILFLLSAAAGNCIKFQISYLFSLLCFYTDNSFGVVKLRQVITTIFSGELIPVAMFPPVMQSLMQFMPFQQIVFIPCGILLGTYSGKTALLFIMGQCIWFLLLGALGRVLFCRAVRQVSVYGG